MKKETKLGARHRLKMYNSIEVPKMRASVGKMRFVGRVYEYKIEKCFLFALPLVVKSAAVQRRLGRLFYFHCLRKRQMNWMKRRAE